MTTFYIIAAISIAFEGRPWLIIPLVITGLIISWWGYRITVPQVHRNLRILLGVLRFAAVLALILLLFKPMVIVEDEKERLPDLGILMDISASMKLIESQESRADALKGILNRNNIKKLEKTSRPQYFFFADSVEEIPAPEWDKVAFDRVGTNLSDALDYTRGAIDRINGAIILLTDGVYNYGANPLTSAQMSPVPIYTVGLGDTLQAKDMGIADIISDRVVYLGDSARISAVLSGYPGGSANLKLEAPEGKIILQRKVEFGDKEREKQTEMKIAPDSVGNLQYRLILVSAAENVLRENDARYFSLKVLPSRIRALLLAGAPSADAAFLKRILSANTDIELTFAVEKSEAEFYGGINILPLENYDVVILLDYPHNSPDKSILKRVFTAIAAGKSIVVIPGNSIDIHQLRDLETVIPVKFAKAVKSESSGRLKPAQNLSSLSDFFPPGFNWNHMPPIARVPEFAQPQDNVVIAAQFEDDSPAVFFGKTKNAKYLIFNAYDLWKCSLQDSEHSHSDSLITGFWHNAMRWLATESEEELFAVSTGKDIFSGGERIPFNVRLYNLNYQPLPGADITMTVSGPEGELELNLRETEKGVYQNSLRLLQEGKYSYQAIAVVGEDTLKAKGEFRIESFNPEFVNAGMRVNLLRNIAAESGGEYIPPGEFENFVANYHPQPVPFIKRSEIIFFPRWAALTLIVLVLCLEWFIRKRSGML